MRSNNLKKTFFKSKHHNGVFFDQNRQQTFRMFLKRIDIINS